MAITFGSGTQRSGAIIAALSPAMRPDGQIYTPSSCIAFDITPSETAATDIEHVVALAEAHDSVIADDCCWAHVRETTSAPPPAVVALPFPGRVKGKYRCRLL